jgi:hypothetical protein
MGIGLVLVFQFSDKIFPIIIIAIGVLGLIGFIGLLVKDTAELKNLQKEQTNTKVEPRIGSAFYDYDRRVERALQIAKEKQESKLLHENLVVKEFSGKLEKGDLCMVCKLKLNEKNDVVQCPICESLYHKNHLMEWIKVKKTCPVCSQELLIHKEK